eukprot:1116057-Prymnesium_polylepis.1
MNEGGRLPWSDTDACVDLSIAHLLEPLARRSGGDVELALREFTCTLRVRWRPWRGAWPVAA